MRPRGISYWTKMKISPTQSGSSQLIFSVWTRSENLVRKAMPRHNIQPSPYTNMCNCNNGAQQSPYFGFNTLQCTFHQKKKKKTLSNVPGQHLQLFHVISENSLSLTLRNMMVQTIW